MLHPKIRRAYLFFISDGKIKMKISSDREIIFVKRGLGWLIIESNRGLFGAVGAHYISCRGSWWSLIFIFINCLIVCYSLNLIAFIFFLLFSCLNLCFVASLVLFTLLSILILRWCHINDLHKIGALALTIDIITLVFHLIKDRIVCL